MQPQNIPTELKALRQWVCWKLVTLENGKKTKHPYNPLTGKKASVSDHTTWATYTEALNIGHNYNGIGFVLTKDDPYTIIDLDKPLTEEQAKRHSLIMSEFPSYTELSPSGEGVHIVLKGHTHKGVNRDKVEVYSDLRYMTFTGNVVNNLPITEHQYKLNLLMAEIAPAVTNKPLVDEDQIISDQALIQMAQTAENKDKFDNLCHGNWQHDYKSQSEADGALMSMFCFYSKCNEQVRRLFRQTVLGQREKAQKDDRYLNYTLTWIRSNELPPVDISGINKATAAVVSTALTDDTIASQVIMQNFPPGLIGEMAQYIYDSSRRPVKEIALITAMGIVAGVSGRAYNTYTQAGLNLYLLLLARTGVGKEEMTKATNRIFNSLPETFPAARRFLGAGSFASGQGLVKYLDERPCFLSIFSEFSHTYKRVTSNTAASYDIMFGNMLLQLYGKSGEGDMLMETVYSDQAKNTKNLKSPSLTLLCESTPEDIFGVMSTSDIASGFLPRFTIVEYTGQRPPPRENAWFKPPQELTDRFASLCERSLTLQHEENVHKVLCSVEAKTALKQHESRVDKIMNSGHLSKAILSLWNRAHLKVLKVATLIAVGVDHQNPQVELDHVEWAIDFVTKDVTYMVSKFESGSTGKGNSAQESLVKKTVKTYLGMTPTKKKNRGVPRKVAIGNVIPLSYLKKELSSKPIFSEDRMGSIVAIDKILKEMVKSAELVLVDKTTARSEFGTQGMLYAVGDSW